MNTKKEIDPGDYPVEIKYIEAAIEALCLKRPKDEQEYIRKCGFAILNVAVKTKNKIEKRKIPVYEN